MPSLPSIPIFWSDRLYEPSAQTHIDSLFADDPTLLAAIGRQWIRKISFGDVLNHLDLRSRERLAMSNTGPRIVKGDYLLAGQKHDAFPFRNHLWIGEEDKQAWCILMHREIVLVVPGHSKDRKRKACFEQDSIAILKAPTSAHERLGFHPLIERICHEAAGMIQYAWKDGFVIRDCDGHSGAREWTLTPSRIKAEET
jgi:hypothetical protein